jgi:hypothetical protein
VGDAGSLFVRDEECGGWCDRSRCSSTRGVSFGGQDIEAEIEAMSLAPTRDEQEFD